MTTRSFSPHSSNLIPGLLTALFVMVLAGFGILMLRVLGLGLLPSLLFFSVFALGFVLADVCNFKLEAWVKPDKFVLVFAMLGLVLAGFAWRLNTGISVLEVALFLLLSGFAFGLNLSSFRDQNPSGKRLMILIGFFGMLIFGFLLITMTSNDFSPRLNGIKNALSIDERAQLEVFKLRPNLGGMNPIGFKTQLKSNLAKQLEQFGLALKNNNTAQKALLENPATPTNWRAILERGGLKAVAETHFLKQKINLEKAFRDEDPKAIRDLLLSNEIPAWVRSDLERGGLKDWVHRQFDRQRLIIEDAIQNSDQNAIRTLLKNPRTRPELRALLEQGGVRASIQKRLANLRIALKKAIQTGDLQAVSLVYQHPFSPSSIREILKDGALQPQIKLEIGLEENRLIAAFLKADPQAIQQLKLLGKPAKSKLPADFTVPQQVQESRTQIAIKQLLEQASLIRSGFLTRRTLLNRAIQNGDLNAINSLCPDCTSINPSQTKVPESPEVPETLKIYLLDGGLRAQIKAKYSAQYQVLENAINSGDIAGVNALLEYPDIPSEVRNGITKLSAKDISTGEARAASLLKFKSILENLQHIETKSAVLAALEVVNQTLNTLETGELENKITAQVINNALNEALPQFDTAANKIQTRAVDVALQGALIALTVNEKAAGNLAVQTLIDRAQAELALKAPKTIKTIFVSTLKTARSQTQSRLQKLEHAIDTLVIAEKEAFAASLRKSFGILALIALLAAGFAFRRIPVNSVGIYPP